MNINYMQNSMKILVTGGAGFIASQIADAYITEGHIVTIVDDLSTGFEENVNPAAKFVKINIGDPGIVDLFNKEKFDLVNHHAAQMDVRKSVADPIFDANTNIMGTINLLQSCVKSGVKKIIFASTGGAVYGEQEYFPADESHPTSPISPYGITKLTIEKYLYFYYLEHKLNYTILRYSNVYGLRQNPFGEAGVVAIFINKLLKGEQPVINGSGEQTRDYVFVEDVVKANLLANVHQARYSERHSPSFFLRPRLVLKESSCEYIIMVEDQCIVGIFFASYGDDQRRGIDLQAWQSPWRSASATTIWPAIGRSWWFGFGLDIRL